MTNLHTKIPAFIASHGTPGRTYNLAQKHSALFGDLVMSDLQNEASGESPELEWLEYTDSPEDYQFELYEEDGMVAIWVEAIGGAVLDQNLCNGIMYGVVKPVMNVVELMESTYEPMDDSLTMADVRSKMLSLGFSEMAP